MIAKKKKPHTHISKVGRNILGQMSAKDCCNWRLETVTISDILHLFGQGNLTFIREKSGKSEGILKTDVFGNHTPTMEHLQHSDKQEAP